MSRSKNKKNIWVKLFVSILISLLLLTLGMIFIDKLNYITIFKRLCFPLCRLMVFIAVGLIAGQFIEASGWTKKFAVLAGPFFKFANLGSRCSAAFTAAFFSGVSANAMLYGYLKDGSITKKQLFISNFLNQFPAYFLHLPTTFFIVVPLTGKAGGLYFLLTFSALVLRVLFVLLFGHFFIKPQGDTDQIIEKQFGKENKERGLKLIYSGIKRKFPRRIANVATYVLPIYISVFLINFKGGFDFLNTLLTKFIVTSFIPIDSLSVVILGFTAEFTTGFAAAGALLKEGIISVNQTALALIAGNIIAFPIRALRHQLPRYAGIFSPGLGLKILISGQLLRIVSLIIVGWIFYLINF